MFKPAFSMVSLAAAQAAKGDYVYGVDSNYYYQAVEAKSLAGPGNCGSAIGVTGAD